MPLHRGGARNLSDNGTTAIVDLHIILSVFFCTIAKVSHVKSDNSA